MSSLQPTQIEGDAILCTDVNTLTEIINLNCIPPVQVHDTAVTGPLRLALGSGYARKSGAKLITTIVYSFNKASAKLRSVSKFTY